MPIDAAAALLKTTFDAQVAARGPAKTAMNGEVADDAWNREHFAYTSAIARATGLDFVQLAAVEIEAGNHGVSQIIDALPAGEREGLEARRLQSLHRLGSALYEGESKAFLASLRDPTLTSEEQAERYLDVFVESWSLRTGAMPANGFPPGTYPSSARAADATGLPYEKLATIEYKGGTSGLKRVLERIPDLPNRDRALA